MSTCSAAAAAPTTPSSCPANRVYLRGGCRSGPIFPGQQPRGHFRKNVAIRNKRPLKLRGTSADIRCYSVKPSLLARVEKGPETGEPLVGDGDGVIIVDHGSRRQESNLMLNEFVAMFRLRMGYGIVEPAHMELAEPSIKDAFDSCVQQGASRIIVSPFFLFPGRHWYQDIPALTAKAAEAHPGISYIVTAPLGLHELLVDVVNDRIKHCLKRAAGQAEECEACAGSGRCHFY